MKRVFSSNSQLCHVWANQSQDEGKANNMFFRGNTIYSYGTHYPAAMIHKGPRGNFALVRSDTYSNSTSKHLSEIRNALQGLMPFYCVKSIGDPKEAAKSLQEGLKSLMQSQLKIKKVADVQRIAYELQRIDNAHNTLNELRADAKLKPLERDLETRAAVHKHLIERLKRYEELNTPEMLAKKRAAKSLKEAKAKEALLATLETDIKAFRSTGALSGYLKHLPNELLYVKGDSVLTSRGAQVPLNEAVRLFKDIKARKPDLEKGCGDFTFDMFNTTTNVIHIGCHRIEFREAETVLGPFVGPDLKLVGKAS